MKTLTLSGPAMVVKIRALEAQHYRIRSLAIGRTNAEWIVGYDEPQSAQADFAANAATPGTQSLPQFDGSGNPR